MILGVGIDLIKNLRIAKLLKEEAFIKKVFTEKEILLSKKISSTSRLTQFYAKRFAAKEAFSKAVGCGIGKDIRFLDLSIINEKSGKPKIEISKKLANFLEKHFNTNKIKIDVSLTDEKEFSQALVILS